MLEQDSGRKDHHKFAVSSPFEMNFSQTNDPQEGALLVQAFLRITDPGVRSAIVRMVETMELCILEILGDPVRCGRRRPKPPQPFPPAAYRRSSRSLSALANAVLYALILL